MTAVENPDLPFSHARSPQKPKISIDRVRTGNFFVNDKKHLVREITGERLDGNVYWRSYDLDDGRATGDSLICSVGHILRWANREATPEEVARMQRDDAREKEIAHIKAFAARILAGVPTEMLVDELRERGYDVAGL